MNSKRHDLSLIILTFPDEIFNQFSFCSSKYFFVFWCWLNSKNISLSNKTKYGFKGSIRELQKKSVMSLNFGKFNF